MAHGLHGEEVGDYTSNACRIGPYNASNSWRAMLQRISQSEAVHALIAGYSHRLLYDAGLLEFEALSLAFARSLSPGNEPSVAARWVEGLLSGSGAALVHDVRMRGLIDSWVRSTTAENFIQVLPAACARLAAGLPKHPDSASRPYAIEPVIRRRTIILTKVRFP